jgi:flagellar assembly factor FliW
MKLATSRFGEIAVEADDVITLTQPIIGFQEFRRFVLLPGPEDSAVEWLQSVENGDLAFLVMDPRQVLPEYEVSLGRHELSELAISDASELAVYTLVVVPDDPRKVRTNLKAPIVINLKHRLGKQTVLDHSDYPIQYYLAQSRPASESPEEVSNARTDA